MLLLREICLLVTLSLHGGRAFELRGFIMIKPFLRPALTRFGLFCQYRHIGRVAVASKLAIGPASALKALVIGPVFCEVV